MEQRTAVVGFGCAGFHAVKAMREHGYEGAIDVYTDSGWAPANPMLTTYYIYMESCPRRAAFPSERWKNWRRSTGSGRWWTR
ncbi:MAG: hypothetical protein LUH04_10620 [Clostridium sp.]|nr:hypothetical protein [Clostridium sp.]